MNRSQYNAFCGSLPHTFRVVQWGGAQVWKVGAAPTGKVFAIALFDGSRDDGITFKCGPASFELLKDLPGCRPAPYLASRGMLWIQRCTGESLEDGDLKKYLRESHRLAAANLTLKLRRSLGLEAGVMHRAVAKT